MLHPARRDQFLALVTACYNSFSTQPARLSWTTIPLSNVFDVHKEIPAMFSELADSHLDSTESVGSRRTFRVGPLDFRVWTLNTLAALNSKVFVIRYPSFVSQ